MREEGAEEAGGVMHCFTETWEVAEAALALGFHISFSGIVTFKNAVALKDVARRVPLERMLICRADSLSSRPVPFAARRTSRPMYPHVAAEIGAAARRCPSLRWPPRRPTISSDSSGSTAMFIESRRFVLATLAALTLGAAATGYAQVSATDLAAAAANDRAADVKAMLAKGADANAVDANGEPLIVLAARNGSVGVVDVLIAAKANLNARNPFGDTALAIASSGEEGLGAGGQVAARRGRRRQRRRA